MSMKDYIVIKLTEMGFDESKIERACNATPCESLDQVMEWIITESDKDGSGDGMTPTASTTAQTSSSNSHGSATLKLRQDDTGGTVSESESGVPKSAEQIEAEKRRLEEKIKQRRIEREERERKEEIEREKRRRETGSEMVRAREQLEAQERIRIAEEFRKEKLERERQRKAVLEQIKKDREAMKKDAIPTQPTKILNQITTASDQIPASSNTPGSNPSEPPSKCKIGIRLPNGQNMTQEFTPLEQLAAVRLFIILNRKDTPNTDPSARNFTLLFPPNRTFNEEDYEKTLFELGLCPSARLVVQNPKTLSYSPYKY